MEKGKVVVFRYNPETDEQPYYESYTYPFEAGMSVLDVVLYIYEKIDGTLSFRYGCRNSHCGLCGTRINGKPGLMCRENATPEMTLEPLDNFPVVRDLMVDWDHYDACMLGLRLFLERVSAPLEVPERIERDDLERFKVFSRCVVCHNCTSVCTAFRKNRHDFLGPAGMVQMARHAFDPRDELDRGTIAHSAGIDCCILCGKCDEVCPHGISPREIIELLRLRPANRSQTTR